MTEPGQYINSVDEDEFMRYLGQRYNYEFTVTYNPQRIHSIDYAKTLTHHVITDVVRFTSRASKPKKGTRVYDNIDSYYFNYVVEYTKTGWPHIHGTMSTPNVIPPISQDNFEKMCGRKYGKTMLWATGHQDRVHYDNDGECKGTWQEYIKKEGVPKYFLVCSYYVPEERNILFK